MLHYSLEPSLLLLYQFLLCFNYLELRFEMPTVSLPSLPGLGLYNARPLLPLLISMYSIHITSLLIASQSEEPLPFFF